MNIAVKKSQALLTNLRILKKQNGSDFCQLLTGLGSVIGALHSLSYINSSLQQLFKVEIMISIFYKRKKLKYSKGKFRAQCHTEINSGRETGNQIGLAVKRMPFTTGLYSVPKR